MHCCHPAERSVAVIPRSEATEGSTRPLSMPVSRLLPPPRDARHTERQAAPDTAQTAGRRPTARTDKTATRDGFQRRGHCRNARKARGQAEGFVAGIPCPITIRVPRHFHTGLHVKRPDV